MDEIILKLNKYVEAQPEKNYFPAYFYDICLFDGTKIGSCDLRVGHNKNTYIGGNIGYNISEAYRGHRYASKAVKLLLDVAKEHNLGYVIITCDIANIASKRTCEIAGGTFLEIADVPFDNDLYKAGQRQVFVYKFDL